VGRGDMRRDELRDHSSGERRAHASLGFRGELKNKFVLGARRCWQCFQSKLINRVAEKTSDCGSTRCRPPCLVERKLFFQVPIGGGE